MLAIQNIRAAISQIAQTTLRTVVGQHTLDQTMAETGMINLDIRKILAPTTAEWGVEVTLAELQDIQGQVPVPRRRVSGGGRGGRRPGHRCRGALQAGDDLIVGGLGEIGVELADGEEVPRGVHADQLVGGARDPRLPPPRRDRHGEHHPGGAMRPRDLAGGPRRGEIGRASCRERVSCCV